MAADAEPAHAPAAVAPVSTRQMTNWVPTRKVGTGALAGATTVLVMAFLGPHLKDWASGTNPEWISAALTSIVTFGIQYLVPEKTAV